MMRTTIFAAVLFGILNLFPNAGSAQSTTMYWSPNIRSIPVGGTSNALLGESSTTTQSETVFAKVDLQNIHGSKVQVYCLLAQNSGSADGAHVTLEPFDWTTVTLMMASPPGAARSTRLDCYIEIGNTNDVQASAPVMNVIRGAPSVTTVAQ